MALDGAFLHCLRIELIASLSGNNSGHDFFARIDKIHQPSKEELVISLRRARPTPEQNTTEKLYLSVRANSPRAHFTSAVPDNPAAPPMFCMLLRKKLTGARLVDIRQPGLERVLYFDFDAVNDLGDVVRLVLSVELMGRHSNIILFNTADGRVIDSIKRVDFEMSSVRPVLPGIQYSPPPCPAGRADLSCCEPEELARKAGEYGGVLSAALLAVSHGLSPLICREISHLATRGRDPEASDLTEDEAARLVFYLARVKAAVTGGEGRQPYLLRKPGEPPDGGEPMEFCFMPVTQYGLNAVGSHAESFSSLLDEFYLMRGTAERTKQRAQDILRTLTSSYDRLTRKIANQRRELEQSGDRESLRICGDLIIAGAHTIPKGAAQAVLVDYYDPECREVTVKLNPALSAAANAQKYYKNYRKAQTAEQILAHQIEQGESELKYIDTVFDALSRAAALRELEELREELVATGYLRHQKSKQKPPPPAGPLKFITDDGFTVLVGRNNLQNDSLTLRTAASGDIWMHTKNIPGSHVIIRTGGAEVTDDTLTQAAVLAAVHSRAANSRQVPVDYAPVRNVKKPAGARPGMVIYEGNRTAYVDPDPLLAARLSAKGDEKGSGGAK